jgi:hypothetical protein
MASEISVSQLLDQSGVIAMAAGAESFFDEAMFFASQRISEGIRGAVWERVIYGLGGRAGRAFPGIYRDHLYAFMRTNVHVVAQTMGAGKILVEYDLSSLGGYKEFERGYHHHALIDTGVPMENRKKKSGFVIHPAQVPFPPGYSGEELLNTKEKRLEWWTKVIINREAPKSTGVTSLDNIRMNSNPTYMEVARDRLLNAWIPTGTAPEWLILENGTAEAPPYAKPQDFSFVLREASLCYASSVMEAAIITLHEIAMEAGQAGQVVAVGSRGAPYQKSTGQFVSYKQRLDSAVGSVEPCFAF